MWEAFEHAAFYGLDNLTAIIDVNRLGQTGETMHGWDLDSYAKRAQAFGWHTIEIDGHNVDEIDEAYAEALAIDAKPTAIIAKTKKGKGVAAVEDKNGAHGKPLDDPEAAIAELGGERNLTHRRRQARGRRQAARVRDRARSSCRATSSAPRSRRARPTATRWPRSARARGDVVAIDGEVSNSTYSEIFTRGPSRAVLRELHRRAADARGGGGDPGARLDAVRLDLRGVPLARLRLRPHGGDQPRATFAVCGSHAGVSIGEDGPSQMALEDLADVPRRLRLDGALPVRREPDGEARRDDGRPGRDLVHALDPRGDRR